MATVGLTVLKILVALLGFGLIVFIHEFGHFAVARLCGVQVNEFAIGMGPKLISFRGKLPGIMKKKMSEEEIAAFYERRTAYMARAKAKKNKEDAADGNTPQPYYGTVYSLRLFPLGGFCSMEGEDEKAGWKFDRSMTGRRMLISLAGCFMNLLLGFAILLGLCSGQELIGTNRIAAFAEQATSNAEGFLQKEDQILAVNGNRVLVSNDIFFNMSRDQDGHIDFLVLRDGEEMLLKDVPFKTEEADGVRYIQYDFQIYGVRNNVWATIKESALNTLCYVRQVIYSFFDLITGRIPMAAMSGPVGIISAVSQAVSLDLTPFFEIIALLTINIGVFNLFPLPPLDGSLFVFLALEAVTGKPVSQKLRLVVQLIGIGLIALLFLVVTYQDIVRLIF